MFNFFKKNKEKSTESRADVLANVGADWHCHVLPSIDDGSSSEAETLDMLKKYEALGIKKIVATPHVRADFYKNTKQSIEAAHTIAQNIIEKHNLNLQLDFSAEYYADENFLDLIAKNELIPIENDYILFELPMSQMPIFGTDLVEKIQKLGYVPLLAHPERYRFWHEKKAQIKTWKQMGVYFQLNLLSLIGHYGAAEKKMAEWLIESDYIDAVGTDAHGTRHLERISGLANNEFFKQIEQMPLLNK